MSFSVRVYNDPSTAQYLNDGVNNILVSASGYTRNVSYGSDLSLPTLLGTVRFFASFDEGYAFYRWAYNVNGSTKYSYANPFVYSSEQDIQIRCESQESYAVTYYGEVDYYVDGSYYTYDYDYEDSESGGAYLYFYAPDAPEKTGYNFLGWSTSYGATYPDYGVGDTITIYATSTSSSYPTTLELYSVYEQIKYTYYAKVEYDAGTGSNPPSAQTSSQESPTAPIINFTVSTQEPLSPLGYEFLNWLCTEDGRVYNGGEVISFTATSKIQSSPTTRHLVAQYSTLGSLYVYTNTNASQKSFLIGMPYIYNGVNWTPCIGYVEHLGEFVQGTP